MWILADNESLGRNQNPLLNTPHISLLIVVQMS